MIEKTLHGPIELLVPDEDLNGILEIAGINVQEGMAFTTHVFLDEVQAMDPASLQNNPSYAGSFSIPDDAASVSGNHATVRLDVTHALRKAEQDRPNFHITFFTDTARPAGAGRIFQYESVHILHHVPENTDLGISAQVTCGLAIDHEEPLK